MISKNKLKSNSINLMLTLAWASFESKHSPYVSILFSLSFIASIYITLLLVIVEARWQSKHVSNNMCRLRMILNKTSAVVRSMILQCCRNPSALNKQSRFSLLLLFNILMLTEKYMKWIFKAQGTRHLLSLGEL